MAWWEWLLISLGGYIIVGIIGAALSAYIEGRTSPGRDFDAMDVTVVGCVWPVAIIALAVLGLEELMKFFHGHGKTYPERKAQRQSKRDYDKMITDFAKEHDLNPAKLKKRDKIAA